MPDEPHPPDPPAASASIGDHNHITDSTVNLTSIDQRGQQVGTQYNAGGNITVSPWQPRWEPSAAEAQALLDALPGCSRMPFAPNPHVVGRDDVLLALATALHGGARVAIGPKAAVAGIGGIGNRPPAHAALFAESAAGGHRGAIQ